MNKRSSRLFKEAFTKTFDKNRLNLLLRKISKAMPSVDFAEKSLKMKELHDSIIGDDHVHEWSLETPGGVVTIDYVTPQGVARGPAKLFIYTQAK